MNEQSINISFKSLLWIVVSIGIIISLIIFLNFIDNSKKYNHYKSLNENIIKSEYYGRFSTLLNDLSKDSTSFELVKQTLQSLEEDIPSIDYAEIYLPDSAFFYKIENGRHYDYQTARKEKYLPNRIKKFIPYLEKYPNPNIDTLYGLTKEDSNLKIVYKIGDGYLFVSHENN